MVNDGPLHLNSGEDIGSSIIYTAVETIVRDIEYFIQEFKDEIKDDPHVLRECSRWWHRLNDLSSGTLDIVRDFVRLKPEVKRELTTFRSELGRFLATVDQSLQVSLDRVRGMNAAGECKAKVKAIALQAQNLHDTLAGVASRLLNHLPTEVITHLNGREIVSPRTPQ
jgi:hypothetical protein